MKSVVIIGGGFGGLAAARVLSGRLPPGWQLVIISEQERFTFKPLIHEVATGAFGAEVVCESIPANFRKASFVKARAVRIDAAKRLVHLREGRIPYDYLVLASGSKTNFYGVPGAGKHSLPLASVDDALALKNNIVALFKSEKAPRIVVVGAGPTGVELSAEISEFCTQIAKERGSRFSVTVIERSPQMIPQVSTTFRKGVERLFAREKITLLLGRAVTRVGKDFVVVDGKERLPASMVVWTAGMHTAIPKLSPVATMSRGWVVADEFLRVPKFRNFYAVGDCALVSNGRGGFVPWLAQSAVQEGKAAGKNILAAIRGQNQERFVFRQYGFLLPVGKGRALAQLSFLPLPVMFGGFFAWWFNRTIYLMNMLSFWHKARVAWLWTLGLFRKRDEKS